MSISGIFLCLLSVHVNVQVKGWCMTGCLTCNQLIPHCVYCKRGFYTVRDGAYSHCRECPKGCASCSDPRHYPTNYCAECKDGYYGNTCSLSCSIGFYMSKCSRINGTCYQNKCKLNFNGNKCDQYSGGRFGKDCRSVCPKKCVSCSSETVCDERSGGFWGNICQNNCPRGCSEDICLTKSGECLANKSKPVLLEKSATDTLPGDTA
ncbi:multiple epidermal growth factor-like domains protein 10 isoform X2 [Mercenaria mercenaria]|uniref:multiple epidermal growth factor-like domains protein 10 isoform X2 n=1 Tax=Mercenaria mercenaria TaxID=6596 RepID=UPI00234F3B33|nr:multiple epidermal growth factor-like domains protein 10 isoform X2 [Mercenaria mercenaria]